MGPKVYPSDVSREQFEIIRPLLEGTKHRNLRGKRITMLLDALNIISSDFLSKQHRTLIPAADF
jgi:hypothetical protein